MKKETGRYGEEYTYAEKSYHVWSGQYHLLPEPHHLQNTANRKDDVVVQGRVTKI